MKIGTRLNGTLFRETEEDKEIGYTIYRLDQNTVNIYFRGGRQFLVTKENGGYIIKSKDARMFPIITCSLTGEIIKIDSMSALLELDKGEAAKNFQIEALKNQAKIVDNFKVLLNRTNLIGNGNTSEEYEKYKEMMKREEKALERIKKSHVYLVRPKNLKYGGTRYEMPDITKYQNMVNAIIEVMPDLSKKDEGR